MPVAIDEMKVLIGLVMLMGIIHKPFINLYFTTDVLYTPIFSQVMNCNQFNLILKFLHFHNNEDPTFDQNDDNCDNLHKVFTSDGITLDFLICCGKRMFHADDPNSDMPTTERIPSVLMES